MRHATSRTIDALAIVITLSAVGLWVRSYHTVDVYRWSVEPGGGLDRLIIGRSVETTPGRIVLRTHSPFG